MIQLLELYNFPELKYLVNYNNFNFSLYFLL